jgi:hypothetical protein
MFGIKVDIDVSKILASRGLEDKGRVQKIIDSEVLRLCDPYVPKDTSQLIRSGIQNTQIGSGQIIYSTPYARKQYYIPMHHDGIRCAYWFEQMKRTGGKEKILAVAKKASEQ